MHSIFKPVLINSCVLFLLGAPLAISGQTDIEATEVEFMSGETRLQGRFFRADASMSSPTVLLLSDLPGENVIEASPLGLGRELSRFGVKRPNVQLQGYARKRRVLHTRRSGSGYRCRTPLAAFTGYRLPVCS